MTGAKEPTVRIQKIRRNTVKTRLIIFGTLAFLLLICSIFSEYLTPYDPYLQDLSNAKAAPSAAHLFGTDRYGRDMLSRVIVGSRASIYSTLLLVAIITVLGTCIGVFCGWHGRWIDTVLMRISDMFLAFPGLVFALAVAGVLGGGLQNAIIALAAISWPKYARIARSQTLSKKETPWLKAAKLSGSSSSRELTLFFTNSSAFRTVGVSSCRRSHASCVLSSIPISFSSALSFLKDRLSSSSRTFPF